MTSFSLALVLLAAVLHAWWNLCAKRAGGGLPFVWLLGVCMAVLYLPVATGYLFLRPTELTGEMLAWIAGSGAIKTVYSLVLQRAYRSGDFSLVYPVARGVGPLLATFAAVILLREQPTPLALAGALLIVGAVFWVSGGWKLLHQDRAHLRPAIVEGVLCGCCIACYTVWDRRGVSTLAIPPILYDAGTTFVQVALLTPFAAGRGPEVRAHWRDHRRLLLAIAVLAPAAYVLVLTAMRVTPVSYVAPAREVSIVIGAFLGARLLGEADGRRRLLAAVVVATGVVALALG